MIKTTEFGFRYEAASVERLWSDRGSVGLLISTPLQALEIRVTPSGLIRLGALRKPWPHELARRT